MRTDRKIFNILLRLFNLSLCLILFFFQRFNDVDRLTAIDLRIQHQLLRSFISLIRHCKTRLKDIKSIFSRRLILVQKRTCDRLNMLLLWRLPLAMADKRKSSHSSNNRLVSNSFLITNVKGIHIIYSFTMALESRRVIKNASQISLLAKFRYF